MAGFDVNNANAVVQAAAVAAQAPEQTRPFRLLLVEDNPGDVFLCGELLAKVEIDVYDLDHVESLAAACEKLPDNNFDIALVDLSLPDSLGIETVSRIREVAPTTPLVVLTGSSDGKLAIEALNLGAQDFLVKGNFTADTLGRTIRHSIERHRLVLRNMELQQQVVEAERARVASETEAAVAARATSSFVSNVTHELFTPLTGILGSLQLASNSCRDEPVASNLVRALDDAHCLQRILTELIEVSKAETGSLHADSSRFDLVEIVDRVQHRFLPLANSKGIDFRMHLNGAVTELVGDRVKISYVIDELLDNAIKFTAAGGVTLTVTRTRAGVEIDVIDTGCGIRPDLRKYLFRSLQSDLGYLNDAGRSIGLGLSLCQSYVLAMDGRLTFTSEPGRGSHFSAFVPDRVSEDALIELAEHGEQATSVGSEADSPTRDFVMALDPAERQAMKHTIMRADIGGFLHWLELASPAPAVYARFKGLANAFAYEALLELLDGEEDGARGGK